jgi:hypothetical protein
VFPELSPCIPTIWIGSVQQGADAGCSVVFNLEPGRWSHHLERAALLCLKPAYLTFKRAEFYPPSEKFLQTDIEFEMPSIPSAQNLFALDGLVAVVTGGGSGIGLMISRALASNGASSVYILGLPDDPLEEVAKQSVRTWASLKIALALTKNSGALEHPSNCL